VVRRLVVDVVELVDVLSVVVEVDVDVELSL
jgi:hypothetical protein